MNHPLNITTLHDAEHALEQIRTIKTELLKEYSSHIFFTEIYITSTEQLINAASASADKSHPQHQRYKQIDARFMHNLIYQFSKRYLDAYSAHKRSGPAMSSLWSQVFNRSTEIEDAGTAILLGALVHMSFDLPLILNTPLANGEPLLNPHSKKEVETYLEIDSILSESVPKMAVRIEALQNQLGMEIPPSRGWLSYSIYNNRFSRWLSKSIMYWLIRLTRQEARWLDNKLRTSEQSQNDIEKIVRNRLNLIRGDGSYFWYMVFLSYGLVVRNLNRTKLSD